jgi:hypothetical protein
MDWSVRMVLWAQKINQSFQPNQTKKNHWKLDPVQALLQVVRALAQAAQAPVQARALVQALLQAVRALVQAAQAPVQARALVQALQAAQVQALVQAAQAPVQARALLQAARVLVQALLQAAQAPAQAPVQALALVQAQAPVQALALALALALVQAQAPVQALALALVQAQAQAPVQAPVQAQAKLMSICLQKKGWKFKKKIIHKYYAIEYKMKNKKKSFRKRKIWKYSKSKLKITKSWPKLRFKPTDYTKHKKIILSHSMS